MYTNRNRKQFASLRKGSNVQLRKQGTGSHKKYRIRPNYRTVPLAFSKLLGKKRVVKYTMYLIKVHVEDRSAENCLFNDAYVISLLCP